jgi:hypothetical protein
VLYVGADPQCPKEFPFSFSFKSKQREFNFCLRTKEERDNYLEYFEMLEKVKRHLRGEVVQDNPERQGEDGAADRKRNLDSQETNEDDKEEHSPDDINKGQQLAGTSAVSGGLGSNAINEMKRREHETEQEYKRRMRLIEERQLLLSQQQEKI